MKNRDMSIHIAIGLMGLFVASFFVEIVPQATVGLSVATLLFTIAQLLDSQVSYWSESLQKQFEVFSIVGNLNLSPKNLMVAKMLSKYQDLPKKQKVMRQIASALYCTAFIILFLAFVVPISISEKVGTSVTVLSSALLFLSIWFVDKQQENETRWIEIQIAALLTKDSNTQTEIENNEGEKDGQNLTSLPRPDPKEH